MSKFLKDNQHWIPWSSAVGLFVITYIIIGCVTIFFEDYLAKDPAISLGAIILGLLLSGTIIIHIIKTRKQLKLNIPKMGLKQESLRILKLVVTIFVANFIIPNVIIDIGKSFGHVNMNQRISTNQSIINHITNSGLIGLIGITILGICIAPVVEEFLYRGILIGPKPNQIKNRTIHKGHRLAMTIIAIIIFAGIHIINSSVALNYSGIILLIASSSRYLVLAIILCCTYYQSGNLIDNIKIHATWNILSFALPVIFNVI